jgi:hypothetical protein
MAQSFNSLLWSNIIAAFAGSSTEALGAAIVNVSTYSVLLICRSPLPSIENWISMLTHAPGSLFPP